ncbi:MAG: alpha/beta hydrolase [Sandaracinaceae bacterium]|jgi:pimeloyl-ACP methyl ester carboxylesterase|nr:alpha/beta hydrolase [Sandaracinaceae bacterium]
MPNLKVEERRVTSFDGTDIAYHVVGEGPAIMLGNGLGGSWKAWKHQIAYLSDRYRFISWDYRGLYRSGPPADKKALAVPDHVKDALVILEHEKIERTAFLGWSMGVQVGIELFRVAPERIATFVLINGVAGRPWETVLDMRAMKSVVPRMLGAARTMPGVIAAVTRKMVTWPETAGWAKRMGLASKTLDEELWGELAGSFKDLDMDVYVQVLQRLGDHDGWDVLPTIDVPTLVIAGDRDMFTPRSASERMVHAIPGSELMVVPGGTHYAAVEYPELINLRIEKFFRERGYASPRSPG